MADGYNPPMTETRLWDRAAVVPVRPNGRRLPEVVALPDGLPTAAELFDYMRDAEMRFETLRLRIEERTQTARGEDVVAMDAVVRHPGDARVMTTRSADGPRAEYEVWISDGEIVRTYASAHGCQFSDLPRKFPVLLPDLRTPAIAQPCGMGA